MFAAAHVEQVGGACDSAVNLLDRNISAFYKRPSSSPSKHSVVDTARISAAQLDRPRKNATKETEPKEKNSLLLLPVGKTRDLWGEISRAPSTIKVTLTIHGPTLTHAPLSVRHFTLPTFAAASQYFFRLRRRPIFSLSAPYILSEVAKKERQVGLRAF